MQQKTRSRNWDFLKKKLCAIFGILCITSSVITAGAGSKIEVPALESTISNTNLKQPITVSGSVTSGTDGSPLIGANIIIQGSTSGVITDVSGKYSIEIPGPNSVLVFSYVGFLSQEVQVNGRTTLNIILEPDISTLSEVVVIGYGTQQKADLTGSVSQVGPEVLESQPTYNVEEVLKSRAAGVRVTNNSGTPGGRIEVRIRGGNSMIGSNEPLYVVDGFPITGGIEFLNPSDIASVDILKDASATAIYGSRGANGVVMITTRSGKAGQKGKIEIHSYYGMQKEINRYEVLGAKDYAIIANEWLKNEGQEPYFDVNSVVNPGTIWQDLIFRNAPVHNHTLTLSGGGERSRYSWSTNYYAQDGIIKNTDAERGSMRFNISHEVNDRVTLNVSAILGRLERNSLPVDNANFGNKIYDDALSAAPTLEPYDTDGIPTLLKAAYPFSPVTNENPLIFLDHKNRSLRNSVVTNAALGIKIFNGLTFTTRLGLEYANTINEAFRPVVYPGDQGGASDGYSYSSSLLNENVLNYSKTFNEDHSMDIVGGFTYQSYLNRFENASVSGIANNITENYDLAGAETVNAPSNGISEWYLLSGLGRINYSYKSKYLITASIRADGSSRFGADNKWGTFPSGAFAWRISDESFFESVTFVSDLKLRVSYGVTGNTALNPYQSLDRIESVRVVTEGGSDLIGYVPGGIANPDLQWETTTQLDAGFDLSILNGRFDFVFDYYKKNTNNLLASVPLPSSVGFTSTLKNIGEIQNSGVEFGVNANVINSSFRWNVSAQISANRNKVIKLYEGSDILGSEHDEPFRDEPINIAREGEPFGAFYGLMENGLDSNGLVTYVDTDNSGDINVLDRVILGNPYPDFIFGLNNDFYFKNFELNVFIEGVQGRDLFWETSGLHLNSFKVGDNQFADLVGNYWTDDNPDPNAKYMKISTAANYQVSDRFIKDGSYLRIKVIRLGYNFPVEKLSWISKAQIYVSGTNLFTFTDYPGLDPDVNTAGNESQNVGQRLLIGIDDQAYPSAKIFSFGIKLNF